MSEFSQMSSDLLYFVAGIAALILYLFWSAATEMGTRWPKLKRSSRQSAAPHHKDQD
ncbi:MAG: hypothetical protein ACO3EZ_09985 [Prochlorotrichaceae cyanobacterium]